MKCRLFMVFGELCESLYVGKDVDCLGRDNIY